jgi:lipopolysaccharide/colanic/teichoic acid biosynthesis glycosyltransferase
MNLPVDWTIINRPQLPTADPDHEPDLVIIGQPRVFPRRPHYQTVKRVMDVMFCLLASPLILLVMIICAALVWIGSSRPIFFVQERIGKGGRPFRMYKFRTMQRNVDNTHGRAFMKAFVNGQIGQSNDGREIHKPHQASQITAMGRILRKTSLDELPQIINVLRGEMSLVGPRPNMPWEVEEYQLWHHERLEVLPGITGLAQVHGRSSLSFERIVNHDIEYIEHQSLTLDLKILFWTLIAVVRGIGAD